MDVFYSVFQSFYIFIEMWKLLPEHIWLYLAHNSGSYDFEYVHPKLFKLTTCIKVASNVASRERITAPRSISPHQLSLCQLFKATPHPACEFFTISTPGQLSTSASKE